MSKEKDEMSNELLNIDHLLSRSKSESVKIDSAALQRRIIEETAMMSQATQSNMLDRLWQRLLKIVSVPSLTPITGASSLALVLALGLAVFSIQNRVVLNEPVVSVQPGGDIALLSEGLLESQLTDGEVWQELILLDEEIAFAML